MVVDSGAAYQVSEKRRAAALLIPDA